MNAPNRIQAILAQNSVTGIDFVFVHPDQVTLDVHFHRPPSGLAAPLHLDLTLDQIGIASASGEGSRPQVPLTALAWVNANDVLRLTTLFPGDFSLYKIRIEDARMDRYFNDVVFSFKANCPSDLDCDPPAHECPPDQVVDFPINYLARDFWSYRRALLDFASQRYPDWKDRLEADGGIMLAEVMSALGDEFAYYQDRIAREAYLETATQRRSLRLHARLVDYHLQDALGASAWLDFTAIADGNIPAGADAYTTSDDGTTTVFEVGRSFVEMTKSPPTQFFVSINSNEFSPHCWDEDDTCLPVGATELFIEGHHAAHLPLTQQPDGVIGKWVLLRTDPTDPAIPARVLMVRLISVSDATDPVILDPLTLLPKEITRLVWENEQALPHEMDMRYLKVRGNLLPSLAGEMDTKYFVVGAEPSSLGLPQSKMQELVRAIERQGHDGSVTYLFSLPATDVRPLVWKKTDDEGGAEAEVRLTQVSFDALTSDWKEEDEWRRQRSLLGTSDETDRDYTLDDGTWRRVVGYQRIGPEIVHHDYASGEGFTIRFGDGMFGLVPVEETVFKVQYRIGGGRRGNVAAGAITDFDPTLSGIVSGVTNPMPATGGTDPETAETLRQLAPEAFRAITYRAVRSADYAEAAERLPWVQRAGAAFRWTGSWISAFVTPDPLGASTLNPPRRGELERQLDRFRQAGREAHVLDPVYADLDLEIVVCVAPNAYLGDVKERVLLALFGKKGVRPLPGYFSPDRFTFGVPLDRSTLEAAIQSVEGVRAVEGICFRRRGFFDWRAFKELSYPPGMDAIIRVENDPLHPERGTVRLLMEGGTDGLKLEPGSRKCK